MKKIILFALLALTFLVSQNVYAEDAETFKIRYNGEVKRAKEIGTGQGINIILPELDDENFYINAIELAVFEKQESENQWHIYKDDNGEETKKKYIEEPDSLNIQIDFGDLNDYRDKAKYRLAYRYYVQSVDESNIFIAGEDKKDGWRMVGESNPLNVTADGLMFYKNSAPELDVLSFSYIMHTAEGDIVSDCSPSDIGSVRLPVDAFSNGVTVNYTANDFDKEDELSVKYQLVDGYSNDVISSGYLDGEPVVKGNIRSDKVNLKLTVTDDYNGLSETSWFMFDIDVEEPFVTKEFNDYGFVLLGGNLFSDFTVHDDSGVLMTDGSVHMKAYFGDTECASGYLEYRKDGIYRLDVSAEADGEYRIELEMFDKAGNRGYHTFYQTLDNTKPTAVFVSDEINSNATKYSQWMNVSKNIIIDLNDDFSGIKKCSIFLDGSVNAEYKFQNKVNHYIAVNPVTETKTGKMLYSGYVYDNAKKIDKVNNRANVSGEGNRLYLRKYVWLDKTPPVIECAVDEDTWYESPAVFEASFEDKASSKTVADASGINTMQYAVADSEALPVEWNTYSGSIEVNGGGGFYIHLRAVDNAGNETVLSKKIRNNSSSIVLGKVKPTNDYMHTIYYSMTDFFVVKNTAYNTKYHFLLNDTDVGDAICVDARLVSCDNNTIMAKTASVTYPDGNTQRDIVFNMPYIDNTDVQLPDGVYEMYIDISEVKNDGEEIKTHTGLKMCEVVIKRSAPPTPVINVEDGMVTINYPDETVAGSLNNIFVKSKYKREYKITRDGNNVSGYSSYTESFPADDITVTALYTDIAGNTSVTSKRIFKSGDGEDGNSGIDATVDGNNTSVEESRPANVYFIGTRREKQKGINSNIFDFLD